jgi:hypothetical protein
MVSAGAQLGPYPCDRGDGILYPSTYGHVWMHMGINTSQAKPGMKITLLMQWISVDKQACKNMYSVLMDTGMEARRVCSAMLIWAGRVLGQAF